MTTSKTIVFIHGLFQNPASWAPWIKYFEDRGFTCHAPAYPFHEGDPVQLRQHPDPQLGKLTFGAVIRHFDAFISALPEKPILIGHSMGGLAVQKLVNMDKAVAGVAIDSAPPKGIFSFQWSFLKANLPTINPLKGDSICLPSVKWFQYAFCNTMTVEETAKEYEQFVVPESRNIPRSSTGKHGAIDFAKPHVPLLMIAGEKDHIIPASLNKKNHAAYHDKNSVCDLKEFKGRTHYICGQPQWEEVANYVDEWLKK